MSMPLGEAINELSLLPFPEHADSDEFEDWLMELLEFDGHINGVARSVMGGARTFDKIEGLEELSEALSTIVVSTDHDRALLVDCRKYVDALTRVAANLKR